MFRILGHPVSTPQRTMDYLLPAHQNTQICLLLMAPMSTACLQDHLFNPVLMGMQASSSFCHYKQAYMHPLLLCISTDQVPRGGALTLRLVDAAQVPSRELHQPTRRSNASERASGLKCRLSNVAQPSVLDKGQDQH